ncbi:unnamed protein product, partial [Meganyctiphanes norvegica]
KNTLSCQELFTTPILKKVIKNKLEYQNSFQNHCSSFTRKTITKDNPPFTFSPYEALAQTLPPLITEKLEPVESTPQIYEYLPWLKCGLRNYDKNLAEQCAQGHRAPRVLLLGDSRVRGLALQVMENWQYLNLFLTTQVD